MAIGWHLPGHNGAAEQLSMGNMTSIASKQMSDAIGIIAVAMVLNNPAIHPRLASSAADNLMAGLCRLSSKAVVGGKVDVVS